MSRRFVINEQLDMLNHLIAHQNAAIDLLASDKRAELTTNIEALAELVDAGELLEVMDYGDKIAIPWTDTVASHEYENAHMNLCHVEKAELEDGEQISVADFEWHYTLPFGIPFDAPEAIYEADANGLPAGTYHFKVSNDSWGSNNGKYIQFTLTDALTEGQQIRKSCAYNALVTSGTLDIYTNGASLTKLYSVTPTEGQGGTYLGESDGKGVINHWHCVALGYNRWIYSALRQFLNSTEKKGFWWKSMHKWDVKPSQADNYDGFLCGYPEEVLQYCKITKHVTVAWNGDNNVEDVTYDRVFLASLEQIYGTPYFPGKEGEYWEYYKRLLGRTEPTVIGQTYPRYIKYAVNSPTSAQYCFRRSAYRTYASNVIYTYASGNLGMNNAYNASRCAPCLRIGK